MHDIMRGKLKLFNLNVSFMDEIKLLRF